MSYPYNDPDPDPDRLRLQSHAPDLQYCCHICSYSFLDELLCHVHCLACHTHQYYLSKEWRNFSERFPLSDDDREEDETDRIVCKSAITSQKDTSSSDKSTSQSLRANISTLPSAQSRNIVSSSKDSATHSLRINEKNSDVVSLTDKVNEHCATAIEPSSKKARVEPDDVATLQPSSQAITTVESLQSTTSSEKTSEVLNDPSSNKNRRDDCASLALVQTTDSPTNSSSEESATEVLPVRKQSKSSANLETICSALPIKKRNVDVLNSATDLTKKRPCIETEKTTNNLQTDTANDSISSTLEDGEIHSVHSDTSSSARGISERDTATPISLEPSPLSVFEENTFIPSANSDRSQTPNANNSADTSRVFDLETPPVNRETSSHSEKVSTPTVQKNLFQRSCNAEVIEEYKRQIGQSSPAQYSPAGSVRRRRHIGSPAANRLPKRAEPYEAIAKRKATKKRESNLRRVSQNHKKRPDGVLRVMNRQKSGDDPDMVNLASSGSNDDLLKCLTFKSTAFLTQFGSNSKRSKACRKGRFASRRTRTRFNIPANYLDGRRRVSRECARMEIRQDNWNWRRQEGGYFDWRMKQMQRQNSKLKEYFVKDVLQMATHESYCGEHMQTVKQILSHEQIDGVIPDGNSPFQKFAIDCLTYRSRMVENLKERPRNTVYRDLYQSPCYPKQPNIVSTVWIKRSRSASPQGSNLRSAGSIHRSRSVGTSLSRRGDERSNLRQSSPTPRRRRPKRDRNELFVRSTLYEREPRKRRRSPSPPRRSRRRRSRSRSIDLPTTSGHNSRSPEPEETEILDMDTGRIHSRAEHRPRTPQNCELSTRTVQTPDIRQYLEDFNPESRSGSPPISASVSSVQFGSFPVVATTSSYQPVVSQMRPPYNLPPQAHQPIYNAWDAPYRPPVQQYNVRQNMNYNNVQRFPSLQQQQHTVRLTPEQQHNIWFREQQRRQQEAYLQQYPLRRQQPQLLPTPNRYQQPARYPTTPVVQQRYQQLQGILERPPQTNYRGSWERLV